MTWEGIELPDAPMMGVEERLPWGVATADDDRLEPGLLEEALVLIGAAPLAVLALELAFRSETWMLDVEGRRRWA